MGGFLPTKSRPRNPDFAQILTYSYKWDCEQFAPRRRFSRRMDFCTDNKRNSGLEA